MSDTPLLVPMHLDVLVLGQAAANATPFLRFQMLYQQLRDFRSADPAPFACGSDRPPPAGAYLHWTLPGALRHGVQTPDGGTRFPWLPNRWLVARVQHGAPPAQAVKAWVVESDFLDPELGTSPYVDPYSTGADGLPQPTRIGRAQLLDSSLTSLPTQDRPFLQAVGPGSVYFAAYAPGVQNVLAFYDDLTGNDGGALIDQGTFTWHVAGWYSSPEHDPLRGTSWSPAADPVHAGALVNDALGWLMYPEGGAAPPDRSLVHALVSGVPWDRTHNTVPQNYPTQVPTKVQVAFGNTAVDAMAAILRLQGTGAAATQADLLSALLHDELDTLDQPGSSEALNNAIRRHWFLPSPGGTAWTVVNPEPAGSTPAPAPAPVPLTTEQGRALAELNGAQDALDRQERILESMQWTLFSVWWKYQYQDRNTIPLDGPQQSFVAQLAHHAGLASTAGDPPSGADGETWHYLRVQAKEAEVASLRTRRDAARTALQGLLDVGTQELREVPRPQFFAPNDPVVLARGLGRSTQMDPGAAPVCRLVSQTVAALAVAGTEYCAGGGRGRDVSVQVPVLADANGLLPAGVQALHTESFFLSPALFAQGALGDAGEAQAVADAVETLPAPAAGVAFPPDLSARLAWRQPWVPLLLDWEVTVLGAPAYTAERGDPYHAFHHELWRFDGTDFQWAGPTEARGDDFSESDQQMRLQGRTFITPQLPLALAGRLREYVNQHQARDPALQALVEQLDTYLGPVQTQDVLSQRLGGLRALMVQRDFTSTVSPFGDPARVMGDAGHGYPRPFPNVLYDQVEPPWDFAPMAGTFWIVNRLTVMDTQGRTVDLTQANRGAGPDAVLKPDAKPDPGAAEFHFYPIAGRGLRAPTTRDPGPDPSTSPNQRMMQLPPRLQQDARLAFELVAGDGSGRPVWADPALTPVCGWMVPNYLDRSLALYAPDGAAWGEVYLSLQAGGAYVPAWQPDPTSPAAPQSVADIPNPYVRRLVEGLWERHDNGAGFDDLLRVIDEALWSIDPGALHQDEELAVLVGRPLAVVRAELTLQLRGERRYSQDWWNTFALPVADLPAPPVPAPLGRVDGGVGNVPWPVRLGSQCLRDDGLVGYWRDDAAAPGAPYATFNTVTLPEPVQAEDYLRQIGPGNYLQLCATDDTVQSPDLAKNQVARLTLLLDPRGQVHACTGLLPVVETRLPSTYTTQALKALAYLFRAGPFLTSPDQVRVPPPAEQKGTWGWFDRVLNATVAPGRADGKVRFAATPPLVKEGWLKFTPAPPAGGGGG